MFEVEEGLSISEICQLWSDKFALERFQSGEMSMLNTPRLKHLTEAGLIIKKYTNRDRWYEITPFGLELLEKELPEL